MLRLVLYLLFLCNILFVFLQSCRFAFSICSLSPLCGDEIQQRTLQSKMNFTNIFFLFLFDKYIGWTQIYIKAKQWRLIFITLLCWCIKEREQYLTNISVEWVLSRCVKKYNHIWQIFYVVVEMYYSIKAIQNFSTNISGKCEAGSL